MTTQEKEMKHCPKCFTFKPLDYFLKSKHTKDGVYGWCKTCTRQNSSNGYYKNREKRSAQIKKYAKTKKGRAVSMRASMKWIEENPKKYLAYLAVTNAKRIGFLKVKPCQVCGDLKVNAHHEDYDRPFEVLWLCPAHHKKLHIDKIEGIKSLLVSEKKV